MGDGQQVFRQAGHQHNIFMDGSADHFDAPVRQQGKAGDLGLVRTFAPQDHGAPFACPPRQLQLSLRAGPPIRQGLTATLAFQPPDQLPDSFGAALPEQILLSALLALGH